AKFLPRRTRENALNAVTNHYQCQDERWLILSLLNEDRQWPTLAKCLGREDLTTDPRFATRKDRHANSLQLVKIFDEVFATRPLAEWRKILDGNGLVFGVVGILDDIPHDKQMIENEVLVPFENDTMLTVNSPIFIDGARKVQPRKPPGVGEHSDEILRRAGYDEAAIQKLRASGAVACFPLPADHTGHGAADRGMRRVALVIGGCRLGEIDGDDHGRAAVRPDHRDIVGGSVAA